ncbi:MAG: hypothetical protein LQ346_009111, partial [Caloplaca aetnensis]
MRRLRHRHQVRLIQTRRSAPAQPRPSLSFPSPFFPSPKFARAKRLTNNPGISSTTFSIPSRLVTITSTAPPSTIIATIQSTGRDAILRGSGRPDSAAVCILELPPSSTPSPPSQQNPSSSSADVKQAAPTTTTTRESKYDSPVRGLARLIQLSEQLTLLDLTLTNLPEGRYRVSVRKTGDISAGSASLGPVYDGDDTATAAAGKRQGGLGLIEVDAKGRGNLVGEV